MSDATVQHYKQVRKELASLFGYDLEKLSAGATALRLDAQIYQ